jgi:16S rRNA (guanine527-N7)-methyltransferase
MTAKQIEAAIVAASLRPLDRETAERFAVYLDLLLKWNAKLNLTAIREPEMILQRHFLECIFLAQNLPQGITSLLDFGSGGGFPGIPISICRPEIGVTLGESQNKKAAFLREAVRNTSTKADVFSGRIETLDRVFNAVTLRAVDKMHEALAIAAEKVASQGWLIFFSTEASFQSLASPFHDWTWRSPLPIPGSQQGILLFGQKP